LQAVGARALLTGVTRGEENGDVLYIFIYMWKVRGEKSVCDVMMLIIVMMMMMMIIRNEMRGD